MKQFFIEACVFIVLCFAMVAIKIIEPFAKCIDYICNMQKNKH